MADKNPYDAPRRHPHELEGSRTPWLIGCIVVAIVVVVLAVLAFGALFVVRSAPMPSQPVRVQQTSPTASETVPAEMEEASTDG